MNLLPFGTDEEKEFWEGEHRLWYATGCQLSREYDATPDERLDSLGWEIFDLAVQMGMHHEEAAGLAMDGNLRQRKRVHQDLVRRLPAHWLIGARAAPRRDDTPDELDPARRLAYWREQLTDPQFVYFVQQGKDGPIKIGRARDPDRRLSTLQTGNAEDLLLRDVIPGDHALEVALHARFAPARIRGEWFGAEYLPVILTYAVATAEEAVLQYDGSHKPPAILLGGAGMRSAEDVGRVRREIERLWLEGHQLDEIASLTRLSPDEIREHLAEMRRSTLYDVNRPGGYRGKRPTQFESISVRRSA